MREERNRHNKKIIIRAMVFALIVGIVALVIWFLTYKNESYTSTETGGSDYGSLECTSSNPTEPFFAHETAQRATHDVKILFTGGEMKEMSYRYDGTYNSDNSAKDAEAWMHADYNKYMGENGVKHGILNPVFSVSKSKLTISLYAESKKVNKAVARLFFINEEEYGKMGGYAVQDYRKIYESKGFTCKIQD